MNKKLSFSSPNKVLIPKKVSTIVITDNADEIFRNCTSLKELPSKLLSGFKRVSTFKNTFRNCDGLTTLPADLFPENLQKITLDFWVYHFLGSLNILEIAGIFPKLKTIKSTHNGGIINAHSNFKFCFTYF